MADPNFPWRYTSFFPIVPSDQQIAGPQQSDGKPQGYTGGITTAVSGTITAIGRNGGPGVVTLYLEAGIVYHYELSFVLTASAGMILTGLG